MNTSNFSKSGDNPNSVSIAGSCPKNFKGREYKKLAPKYWFFKKFKEDGDEKFYTNRYKKDVLNVLDPQTVYNELGENSILLCWEAGHKFCHRHLVAEWFKEKLGVEIKPCVGCGFCCIKAICSTGARIYGPSVNLCPALEWRETRYYCKLMELPNQQGFDYKKELYAGEGCCCNLNDWRRDVKDRTSEEKFEIFNIDPIFQVFLHYLGREFISSDVMFMVLDNMMETLQEKGWTKENSKKVVRIIMHNFKQNRSKFQENFIG